MVIRETLTKCLPRSYGHTKSASDLTLSAPHSERGRISPEQRAPRRPRRASLAHVELASALLLAERVCRATLQRARVAVARQPRQRRRVAVQVPRDFLLRTLVGYARFGCLFAV